MIHDLRKNFGGNPDHIMLRLGMGLWFQLDGGHTILSDAGFIGGTCNSGYVIHGGCLTITILWDQWLGGGMHPSEWDHWHGGGMHSSECYSGLECSKS